VVSCPHCRTRGAAPHGRGPASALLALALVLGLGAGSAGAQAPPTQYLLRVNKDSALDRVCQTYGLKVVRSIGWLYLYVVTGPADLPSDTLVTRVKADKSVWTFEPDYVASTGETAGAPVGQTTQSLEEALAVDRTLVDFYGTPAWTGYARQPALGLLNVDAARDAGHDGSGMIVAVIDSGVDPSSPLLADVLLPGYDFTRNQPGASEWGDLDQSTAAILDSDKCRALTPSAADANDVVTQSTPSAADANGVVTQSIPSATDADGVVTQSIPSATDADGVVTQSTAAILDSACLPGILNQSTAAILDSETATALAGAPPLPAAFGHGTMVAGLVHAVAPRAQILPLKAFRADGTGRSSDIAQAIYYAVLSGARVLNLSFTFTSISQEVMYATAFAAVKGSIVVAAAGNEGLTVRRWPAEHRWVVGVGATTLADARAPFSNQGYNTFKVGAPGVDLVTTYPGGRYAAVSGTSFSAPLLSGTVALMGVAAPGLDWGATSDVVSQGVYAAIADVARSDDNNYPQRLVVPEAVDLAPLLQRPFVKRINNVK
jgi:subtilisin family serine protease